MNNEKLRTFHLDDCAYHVRCARELVVMLHEVLHHGDNTADGYADAAYGIALLLDSIGENIQLAAEAAPLHTPTQPPDTPGAATPAGE